MIVPVGADTIRDAVRMGSEVFHTLKKQLAADGHNTNVGDEGGFAPGLASAPAALDFIMKSIEKAGYTSGRRHAHRARLRLDRVLQGRQVRSRRRRPHARAGSHGRIPRRAGRRTYPIFSIEDGMAEDDWDGWKALTDKIGRQVQLVGDDLFVTNSSPPARRHQDGRRQLHPRQGQPDRLADARRSMPFRPAHQRWLYAAVMSHRSGETEDSTIADLAVATNCGQIKTGSLAALRPHRQVQPADPRRGRAWPAGALRRVFHPARLIALASIEKARVGSPARAFSFRCGTGSTIG